MQLACAACGAANTIAAASIATAARELEASRQGNRRRVVDGVVLDGIRALRVSSHAVPARGVRTGDAASSCRGHRSVRSRRLLPGRRCAARDARDAAACSWVRARDAVACSGLRGPVAGRALRGGRRRGAAARLGAACGPARRGLTWQPPGVGLDLRAGHELVLVGTQPVGNRHEPAVGRQLL